MLQLSALLSRCEKRSVEACTQQKNEFSRTHMNAVHMPTFRCTIMLLVH